MQILAELEDVTEVRKRLKVEVSAEVARQEFERLAREYQRHARLPGFRPGKAPLPLIKRRFLRDIREGLLQKLIPESYDQAIREKGVNPLGQPGLDNISFEEGQPLAYEALFEVRPRFVLPQYRGLELRVEERPVQEADVREQLERMRVEQGRLEPVEDRHIQKGDYVTVDLRGEYAFEEGQADHEPIEEKDVVVHVGDEHTHEAFTEALMGLGPGDQKSFEVEYAPDYPEKKLAGHRVRFAMEVTAVKTRVLPDLNDDFAKDVGEFETLAELEAKIRERLEAQSQQSEESALRGQLVETLLAKVIFEVPEVLMEDRVDDKVKDLAYRMASQGVDPRRANVDWARVRSELRQDAEKEVRALLLLSDIGAQEKIDVSEAELEEEFQRVAESTNQPAEKVRQYFSSENRLDGLKGRLRQRKVLDFLLDQARITREPGKGRDGTA